MGGHGNGCGKGFWISPPCCLRLAGMLTGVVLCLGEEIDCTWKNAYGARGDLGSVSDLRLFLTGPF